MSTIRDRGAPIWVSAPSREELGRILDERTAQLGRAVTMAEVIEQLLAERRARLLAGREKPWDGVLR
jgi:hypothetical protein